MAHKQTECYEVDLEEFRKAYKAVDNLLVSMFGTTYEDDQNVECILIDRQRYNRMHFFPVPYSHKNKDGTEAKSHEDRMKAIEAAMSEAKVNMETASSAFFTLFRLWEHEKRSAKTTK